MIIHVKYDEQIMELIVPAITRRAYEDQHSLVSALMIINNNCFFWKTSLYIFLPCNVRLFDVNAPFKLFIYNYLYIQSMFIGHE